MITGKTIRQLFKALNDFNNLQNVLNQDGFQEMELKIYIDEEPIYTGVSYCNFLMKLKEEYVEEFVNEILNIMFCGNNTDYITCRDTKHKIEIYAI